VCFVYFQPNSSQPAFVTDPGWVHYWGLRAVPWTESGPNHSAWASPCSRGCGGGGALIPPGPGSPRPRPPPPQYTLLLLPLRRPIFHPWGRGSLFSAKGAHAAKPKLSAEVFSPLSYRHASTTASLSAVEVADENLLALFNRLPCHHLDLVLLPGKTQTIGDARMIDA